MDALPQSGPMSGEQARRFGSVSLSGCSAEHTMSGLADRFDNQHLWRVTLPALMSPAHDAEIALPEHPRAERFLAREMRKDARRLLHETECDLILIDFVGEHLVNGLRFEGCIVPDIRNAIFEPAWAEIDFSSHPLLAGAELLPSLEEPYWALWRESFAAFHAEILAPKIAAGTRVVVLARHLCRSFLAGGEEHGLQLPPELEAADARLAGLYAWLAGFPGLHLIRFDRPLLVSAEDVPYGGPSPFHPVREAFVPVRAAVLRLMGEAESARAAEVEAIARLLREGAARAHERDQALARAQAAEAEREAAREAAARANAALAAAHQALEAERAAALALVGTLQGKLRQAEAAEAALIERTLRPGPGWRARLLRWSGFVELARHAARRRRWARAERLYRLVLRISPRQPALWVQLGHMLKEQGAVAAAAGAYRMAERLAPGESDAARHLAALAPVMA